MRIAVLIISILGALACGALGMKWLSDYNENKEMIAIIEAAADDSPEVAAELAELKGIVTSAYMLLVA